MGFGLRPGLLGPAVPGWSPGGFAIGLPEIVFCASASLAAVSPACGAEAGFANYPRTFLDIHSAFAYAQLGMDDPFAVERDFLGEVSSDANLNVLYLKPGPMIRAASLYVGLGTALTRPFWEQPTSFSWRLKAGIDLNRTFNLCGHQSFLSRENHSALGLSIKVFESHFADGFAGAQFMSSTYPASSDSDVRASNGVGISLAVRLHNGLRADSAGHPGRKVRKFSQEDPVILDYVANQTEIRMETLPRRISPNSMAPRETVTGSIDSVRNDSVFIQGMTVKISDIRYIHPVQKVREKGKGDGLFYGFMIGGFVIFAVAYTLAAIGSSMGGS